MSRATYVKTPVSSLGTRPAGAFGTRTMRASSAGAPQTSASRRPADTSRLLRAMPPRGAPPGAGVTRPLVGRTDWERMDDIAALDWLRGSCGPRAVETVWLPLLLGKFGDDAADVPLAWLWSKFLLRRRLRGSGSTSERLGYPRGSFRAICAALSDDITRRGGGGPRDPGGRGVGGGGGGVVLPCAAPRAGPRPPHPTAA